MAADSRTEATDRFFDALIERQATLYDAVRAASERYHRFNRSLLEGARQNTRDWTEVGRRIVQSPTDISAVYEALQEAVGNTNQRTLALAREWVEDRVEAQRETREVLRQSFGDLREAVERAQAEAPEFLRNFRRKPAGNATGNGRSSRSKSKS